LKHDLRHLELRHRTWHVRVTIPPSKRPAFNGNQKLYRSLKIKEPDLRKAQAARYAVVAELKAEIENRGKRAAIGDSYIFGSTALLAGQQVRGQFEQAKTGNDVIEATKALIGAGFREKDLNPAANANFVTETMTGMFVGLIAINEHIEAWLTEERFKNRTKADRRLAVRELLEWLAGKGISGTVEVVDSKRAGDFRMQRLAGMHPRTANKRLESLRGYWRWLEKLGYASSNPWIGKSISKRATIGEALERPFTDEEVTTLFANHAHWRMRDVMAIAALSGMRLDEIFQLKVADCADDVFNIGKAKTNAGIRKVPIHSTLSKIIGRRKLDKASTDYLIEEGTDGGWDGNRSMAFSKRFGTYRKSCSISEVHEGNARSRVNFHSWRRWFITKADQAGLREQDVARTVGHKVKGMSFGLYSGGSSLEQLRTVVEVVKLPDAVKLDYNATDAHKAKPVLRRKSELMAKQMKTRVATRNAKTKA
jgi:integrase